MSPKGLSHTSPVLLSEHHQNHFVSVLAVSVVLISLPGTVGSVCKHCYCYVLNLQATNLKGRSAPSSGTGERGCIQKEPFASPYIQTEWSEFTIEPELFLLLTGVC